MIESVAAYYIKLAVVSLVTAWVSSSGLERLKRADWFPVVTRHTDGLNRIVGAVLATAGAVGIHAGFADGTLTVTGLEINAIGKAAAAIAAQWAAQEIIYRGAVKGKGR